MAVKEGIRVIRPWPGVRKGQVIYPPAARRAQLLALRVVEPVKEYPAKPRLVAPMDTPRPRRKKAA